MQPLVEPEPVTAAPRLKPWPLMTTYTLFHVATAAGLVMVPFDASAAMLAVTSYAVRMVAVTAGFHRYFAHRSYQLHRAWQFLVALLGTMAWQRGPLWWASHHREHHRTADTPADPHRPRDGWWHASFLWVFQHPETRREAIPDWLGVPELAWLDRHHHLPPLALAALMSAAFGWPGLVYGMLLPTLLCWHFIGAVNTVGHRYGHRDFESGDESTNNALLALVTFGDGFHNGHHAFPGSARHGLVEGQVDLNYLLLRGLAAAGVVSGLRTPSPEQLASKRMLPSPRRRRE